MTPSFLSQPSLEIALQNIHPKLTVRSLNRKSNFQLRFYHIIPFFFSVRKDGRLDAQRTARSKL